VVAIVVKLQITSGVRSPGIAPEEAPGAAQLALVIARSGGAGISLDGLRRVCGLSPETLDNLLRALITAGQVTVVKVSGERVYRATT
jgi:hypothetical protein